MSRFAPAWELEAPSVAVQTAARLCRYFNAVQSECFPVVYGTDANMVVAAPTGSGKTVILELAILHMLSQCIDEHGQYHHRKKLLRAIYLAPNKALVQEKTKEWQQRFGQQLNLNVVELTGDTDLADFGNLNDADVICTTPEKLGGGPGLLHDLNGAGMSSWNQADMWGVCTDSITRRKVDQGGARFLGEVALLLIDEVHLLNENRGSALEAGVVSRIKMISSLSAMRELPISNARYIAISATIQNIEDVAQWLAVPQEGLFVFGEELRPVKLTTIVKGYPTGKTDFLFERRLNDHLSGVIAEHSQGKPTLIFCSSRKGTEETATHLLAQSSRGVPGSMRGSYVRDESQKRALDAAASQVADKLLQQVILGGIGIHHGNLQPQDRSIVENLFLSWAITVLCATSTLAQGVNLPAHLVILKGTRRWSREKGEAAGNKEYDRSSILQMIGRAGRPQFDTEGVAIIMTQKEMVHQHQNLLSGTEVLESQLRDTFAEYLNAEIVLRNVVDLQGAIRWLKSTFLYVRARKNPSAYKLPRSFPSQEAFEEALQDKFILKCTKELATYGLWTSFSPTEPGILMAQMYIRLPTMIRMMKVRSHAGMPTLLWVISEAEEFAGVCLRRSEKKVLNSINKNDDCMRFVVSEAARPAKAKDRIKTPAEKIFIMVNEALSDHPTEKLDYSMKQELEQVLKVGMRIAACMAKLYKHKQMLAATSNALLLQKCLKERLWDNTSLQCRQLPGIGKLLSERLAAAGMGKLRQLDIADARKIESATQRNFPFGNQVKQQLLERMPPRVDLQIVPLGRRANGSVSFEVRLRRLEDARPSASENHAVLVVGSIFDDVLLAHESLTFERFPSPLTLQFSTAPTKQTEAVLVASLIHTKYIGLDITRRVPVSQNVPLAPKMEKHSIIDEQDRNEYNSQMSDEQPIKTSGQMSAQEAVAVAAARQLQEEEHGIASKAKSRSKEGMHDAGPSADTSHLLVHDQMERSCHRATSSGEQTQQAGLASSDWGSTCTNQQGADDLQPSQVTANNLKRVIGANTFQDTRESGQWTVSRFPNQPASFATKDNESRPQPQAVTASRPPLFEHFAFRNQPFTPCTTGKRKDRNETRMEVSDSTPSDEADAHGSHRGLIRFKARKLAASTNGDGPLLLKFTSDKLSSVQWPLSSRPLTRTPDGRSCKQTNQSIPSSPLLPVTPQALQTTRTGSNATVVRSVPPVNRAAAAPSASLLTASRDASGMDDVPLAARLRLARSSTLDRPRLEQRSEYVAQGEGSIPTEHLGSAAVRVHAGKTPKQSSRRLLVPRLPVIKPCVGHAATGRVIGAAVDDDTTEPSKDAFNGQQFSNVQRDAHAPAETWKGPLQNGASEVISRESPTKQVRNAAKPAENAACPSKADVPVTSTYMQSSQAAATRGGGMDKNDNGADRGQVQELSVFSFL